MGYEPFQSHRAERKMVALVTRQANQLHALSPEHLIYSANAGSYTGAEALIRLKDEHLGFISPDEFIPIAEQNGLIIEIGECVFRKVCQFMSQVKIWEKGIKYIDVNLSVVQCMQERLHTV